MASEASEETSETNLSKGQTPLSMIVPAAALLVAALAVGVLAHLGPAVEAEAQRFQDQSAYNAAVLSGSHVRHVAAPFAAEPAGVTAADLVTGPGSAAGALLLLAFAALFWRRLPVLRRGFEPAGLRRSCRVRLSHRAAGRGRRPPSRLS